MARAPGRYYTPVPVWARAAVVDTVSATGAAVYAAIVPERRVRWTRGVLAPEYQCLVNGVWTPLVPLTTRIATGEWVIPDTGHPMRVATHSETGMVLLDKHAFIGRDVRWDDARGCLAPPA